MLRDLKEKDIDEVMKLWRDGNYKAHSFISNLYWSDMYKKVQNDFLRKSDTIIYEEDGKIEAFISILDDGYIYAIFVAEEIQREGIGKVLINFVKDKYKKLKVKIYQKNVNATMFFRAMGFNKIDSKTEESTSEIEYIMEWNKENKEKIGFIYLDKSISDEVIKKYENDDKIDICMVNVYNDTKNDNTKNVDLKPFLYINKDICKVTDHIGLIAALNNVFEHKKSVLYINYQNDYEELSNVIKDYVLVKKINLTIGIQKPFLIEGNKKLKKIEEIQKQYNTFSIYLCNYDEKSKKLSFKDAFEKRDEEFISTICKM